MPILKAQLQYNVLLYGDEPRSMVPAQTINPEVCETCEKL